MNFGGTEMKVYAPSALDVVAALEFPAECAVRHRVAKKLVQEHAAAASSDRRLVQDVVEEIWWLGVLKPEKVGIAPVNDATREYLEIAVVVAGLRGKGAAKPSTASTRRIEELLHRAIPYPLFLILEHPGDSDEHDIPGSLRLSLAHKRRSQNEPGRFVLEDTVSISLPEDAPFPSVRRSFLESLSMSKLAATSLHTLYQGWIDCQLALRAARLTGRFETGKDAPHATGRREALQEHVALEQEIRSVQARATRERQMAKRVELNLELKRLQARRDAVLQSL